MTATTQFTLDNLVALVERQLGHEVAHDSIVQAAADMGIGPSAHVSVVQGVEILQTASDNAQTLVRATMRCAIARLYGQAAAARKATAAD